MKEEYLRLIIEKEFLRLKNGKIQYFSILRNKNISKIYLYRKNIK
jgi:lantibiotic modifying enzyme